VSVAEAKRQAAEDPETTFGQEAAEAAAEPEEQ
jgi:hypothetical protein